MRSDIRGNGKRTRVVMISASEMRTDARVCREAVSLAKSGYAITLVSLASTPPATVPGVTLKEVPASGGWRPIRLLASLCRTSVGLAGTRGDVYHAHNVHVLPAAWFFSRLRRAKLVYEAHELFSASAPRGKGGRISTMQWLERTVERLLAPRADLLLTASGRYAAQIASALRVDPPLTVPNYPVMPPAATDSPLRAAIGASNDEIVILYQGGYYNATRAIDVVIRAMKLLPHRYRLVLLGFGSDHDESTLRALIAELNLTLRATMIPAVSHQELPHYTAGADIGVIPFRLATREMQLCSPNKLYEYMAASIPVLASPADEIKEVLEETGAGLTYDYDDPADFARQAQALGPDREALGRIGAKGRRAAETRYSWEAAEHLMVDAYRTLLSS